MEKGITFEEEVSLEIGIATYTAEVETLKKKLTQLKKKMRLSSKIILKVNCLDN